MRHLTSLKEISKNEILELLDLADILLIQKAPSEEIHFFQIRKLLIFFVSQALELKSHSR